MEYVLVEEVLTEEKQNTMEREPHEVLHDFFFHFVFLHEVLYSHSILKH